MINLILACDDKGCIGNTRTNDLPWPKIPEDLKLFKRTTHEQVVVMGRKTWESIPLKYRPLPRRVNAIISSNQEWLREQEKNYDKVIGLSSIDDIPLLTYKHPFKDVFIIGGASIYATILESYINNIDCIYISHIYGQYDGDVYFNYKKMYEHFTLDKTIFSHPKFHTNIYKRLPL